MIYGNLEAVSPIAMGWAVDTESKNGCVIDIYIDGKIYITFVVGNVVREDVASSISEEIGFEDSRCGFRIDLVAGLSKEGSKVEFRYNRTGILMNGVNSAFICPPLPKQSVIKGVGGYKFYCGERKEIIEQLSGFIQPEKSDIDMWVQRYALLSAVVTSHGGRFVPVIVPEKIAVAPHLLSEDMRLHDERLAKIVSKNTKNLCNVEVEYPLHNIVNWSQKDKAISKTDSHLSWRAHHFMFELIFSKLGMSSILPKTIWVESRYIHDLSTWEGDNEAEIEDMPWFPDSDDIAVLESEMSDNVVFINPRGSIPMVVLCGHSSCGILSTFIRQIAKVTVYIKGKSVSADILTSCKPELVIHYMAERNMEHAGSEIFTPSSFVDSVTIARAVSLSRKIVGAEPLEPFEHITMTGVEAKRDGWANTAVTEASGIADNSAKQMIDVCSAPESDQVGS